MAADLDPFKPFSAELHVIRRLNSSLHRDRLAPERANSPTARLHSSAAHITVAPSREDAPLLTPHYGSMRPVNAQSQRTKEALHSRFPDQHYRLQDVFTSSPRVWMDNSAAVQRFRFTSATQRSFDEVCFDTKLLRYLKAPETALEKMADPVSERPSSKRYRSQPELWQCIGADWNRRQLRSKTDVRTPISFCSPCPQSSQVPLYTGVIGSKNMENNIDDDFQPLTMKRGITPAYTPTARLTTIPGYTGTHVHVNSAAKPAVSERSPAQSTGSLKESRSPTFGRAAPLSRIVTTMNPCNPFLRAALPDVHTGAGGGVRQRR